LATELISRILNITSDGNLHSPSGQKQSSANAAMLVPAAVQILKIVCRMLERRYLHLDGLRLSYLERGTAAEGTQTFVLLHGLMGSAETFQPLLAEMPRDSHIIALDMPGSGLSDRRDDLAASMPATAAFIEKFLQALDLKKPCLVGHSHGAAVALRLARTAPNRIQSLVLLGPAHPYFEEANPVIRFYLSLPGRIFAYTMPWFPEWFQMMGLRRMAGPQSWDTPERLKPYRDNLRVRGTMSHLLRLLGTWQEDMADLRRLLRKPVKQPTLILWGDCDRAVPVHTASELRAHLHQSELHVLPGVGHRPAEEQPELTAGLISAWMARNETAAQYYKPNSSASQSRIPAFMVPSLEAGD
jgi:magnesium chelatase accessory protein